MKPKVYLASPLFTEQERKLNVRLRDLLVSKGFEVHLPQEEGGLLRDLVAEGAKPESLGNR